MFKTLITGALSAVMALGATITTVQAEDELFVPMLSIVQDPLQGAGYLLQTDFTII